MLKKDVKIGGKYTAKISNKMTVVKITGESRFGGWDAINTATGRTVRIRSAQKLRYLAGENPKTAPAPAPTPAVRLPGFDFTAEEQRLGCTAAEVAEADRVFREAADIVEAVQNGEGVEYVGYLLEETEEAAKENTLENLKRSDLENTPLTFADLFEGALDKLPNNRDFLKRANELLKEYGYVMLDAPSEGYEYTEVEKTEEVAA